MTDHEKALEAAAIAYAEGTRCVFRHSYPVELCGDENCTCKEAARLVLATLPPDPRIAELETLTTMLSDTIKSAQQIIVNRDAEIAGLEAEARIFIASNAGLTDDMLKAREQISQLESQVATMRAALDEIKDALFPKEDALPPSGKNRLKIAKIIDEALTSLGPDPKKPDECKDGCPPFQTCNFCQGVRPLWRERWYGSSDLKGWSIISGERDVVAYIGGDESMSEAISAVVIAHNQTLGPDQKESSS